jgi:hypothetical protein
VNLQAYIQDKVLRINNNIFKSRLSPETQRKERFQKTRSMMVTPARLYGRGPEGQILVGVEEEKEF